MLGHLRSRPLGWALALVTAAAMAATMVIAPSGGATTPLKEYSATFESECVNGPGVLNIEGIAKAMVRFKAPQSVSPGQSIELTEASVALTFPTEQTEDYVALGLNSLRGHITNIPLDGSLLEPAKINLGRPSEYPDGLPFFATVEKGKPVTFAAPSMELGEVGRTYSYGPLKVTNGVGESVRATIDDSPGFEENTEGGFKATGSGVVAEYEGFNANGEHAVGPLTIACNAPPGVVVAEIPVLHASSSSTISTAVSCTYTTRSLSPLVVEPSHGPAGGGTTVTITGSGVGGTSSLFFGPTKVSFEVLSENQIRVVTPPGSGVVSVDANGPPTPCPSNQYGAVGTFTYEASVEKAEYKNWVLSGNLTPKRLGQAITLPAGSTFNGTAELDPGTGAGSLTGSVAVPPFSASFKLFGLVPASLGLTLTQSGPIAGTIAKSEAVAGDEALTLPVKLKLGVTSVGLLGLNIPTRCTTAEPVSFALMTNLTHEELLSTGWSFAGTTTLPKLACEGGLLGGLFGPILSALLSGAENPYAIKVTPPGG